MAQPNIWLTSDLHFGHRNIIDYCERPFFDVGTMDERLEEEWHDKVSARDEVYFLGDWTLDPDPERVMPRILSLPGHIFMVLGNHDRALDKVARGRLPAPRNITILARHKEMVTRKVAGMKILMSHFPIDEWDGIPKRHDPTARGTGRTLHAHGHSHGKSRPHPYRVDVGWDAHQKILHADELRAEFSNVAQVALA